MIESTLPQVPGDLCSDPETLLRRGLKFPHTKTPENPNALRLFLRGLVNCITSVFGLLRKCANLFKDGVNFVYDWVKCFSKLLFLGFLYLIYYFIRNFSLTWTPWNMFGKSPDPPDPEMIWDDTVHYLNARLSHWFGNNMAFRFPYMNREPENSYANCLNMRKAGRHTVIDGVLDGVLDEVICLKRQLEDKKDPVQPLRNISKCDMLTTRKLISEDSKCDEGWPHFSGKDPKVILKALDTNDDHKLSNEEYILVFDNERALEPYLVQYVQDSLHGRRASSGWALFPNQYTEDEIRKHIRVHEGIHDGPLFRIDPDAYKLAMDLHKHEHNPSYLKRFQDLVGTFVEDASMMPRKAGPLVQDGGGLLAIAFTVFACAPLIVTPGALQRSKMKYVSAVVQRSKMTYV